MNIGTSALKTVQVIHAENNHYIDSYPDLNISFLKDKDKTIVFPSGRSAEKQS